MRRSILERRTVGLGLQTGVDHKLSMYEVLFGRQREVYMCVEGGGVIFETKKDIKEGGKDMGMKEDNKTSTS